jgi:hypothetical protein
MKPPKDDVLARKKVVDEVISESLRISLELQRQLGKIQRIIEESETEE